MTRPGTPLAAAALVIIGAVLAGSPTIRIVPLMVVTALAVAAANVYNDRCDMAADKVNRPDRPLIAGVVTVRQADRFVLSSSLTAILIAAVLGVGPAVATALLLAVGLAYSLVLQRVAFVGEATVAILFAAPLLYGAAYGGQGTNSRTWIAFALTAIYVGGREILKGIPDLDGDSMAGYRTSATLVGQRASLRLYRAMAVGFCVASTGAAVILRDLEFLVASVVCAMIPTLRILWALRGDPSLATINRMIGFSGLVFATGLLPLLTLAR